MRTNFLKIQKSVLKLHNSTGFDFGELYKIHKKP